MENKEEIAIELKTKIEDDIKNIFNKIPELDGIELLGSLLSLPDDKFKVLSEIFLSEYTNFTHSSDFKINIINATQTSGEYPVIKAQIEAFISEIDKDESFSVEKKDFLRFILSDFINVIDAYLNETVPVPFELLDYGRSPVYMNEGDAGMDVFSPQDYDLNPGDNIVIPVGIKVAVPRGYEIQVRNRSGQSIKTKLRISNGVGTIDSLYRDELGVIIENIEPAIADIDYSFNDDGSIRINSILHGKSYHIDKGQRIAQLILSKIERAALYQVDDIHSIGGDRKGGFGHSDLNNV